MRRWALGLLLLVLIPGAAWGAEAKRVLLVHSFGSTAPPFTTHSTAFQTTLTNEMGERVDMDEVSLDMARYAQPDMEGPFVGFLLARLVLSWAGHKVSASEADAASDTIKRERPQVVLLDLELPGMDTTYMPINYMPVGEDPVAPNVPAV